MPNPLQISNESSSEFEVASTLSEHDFSYLRQGWTKQAVHDRRSCSPIIAGTRPGSLSDSGNVLYLLCTFEVPCATVKFDTDVVEPTDAFVKAITSALLPQERSSKHCELQKVLSKFGNFVATRMDIGYSLVATDKCVFASIVSTFIYYLVLLGSFTTNSHFLYRKIK